MAEAPAKPSFDPTELMIPGHGTEYSENFCWDKSKESSMLASRDEARLHMPSLPRSSTSVQAPHCVTTLNAWPNDADPYKLPADYDPTGFCSAKYPGTMREPRVRKDDRGKYIDPYKNISVKPYGRKLMYDDTHPEKMYPSQWSSELGDVAGPYSFPFPSGLKAEIPWCKDLMWKRHAETCCWPTEEWKEWRGVAMCPPYAGYDDQADYNRYKTQVPMPPRT